MGLDVTLGALVLLAGLRGWLKGFILQATQLGALVGCIYAAEPLRDLARSYIHENFPAIQPDLLDKLLWWCAAVISFVLISGLASGLVRAYRRRPYGDFELNRGDQGAGFWLGALKGSLVAAFLTAGIVHYAPTYAKYGGWVEQQVQKSRAVAFSQRYQPAERIWRSAPVQALVVRVKSRGLWVGPPKSPERPSEPPPVQTASRPPKLALPDTNGPLDPTSPSFLRELDEALRGEGVLKSR